MYDQGAAWIRRDSPSEKRQTLEFNLKVANVNTNIFMNYGSAILVLVTVTFILASGHPIFLDADPPNPTTLIHSLS